MNFFTLFIPIVLGLAAGYLVNYIADVLPFTRRLSQPACLECSHPYSLKDYLLLKPCPACGHKRNVRTYLVLFILLAATIYIWIKPPTWTNPPSPVGFFLAYVLLIYLGVVFVIDAEHRLIMHPVSITGAMLGLVIGTYIHSFGTETFVHGLGTSVLGGVAGFGSMLLLYYLGGVFTRFMSKRRGEEIDEVALGFGDVNLSGVIGLLLGWPRIFGGLVFTILAGGIGSILVIVYMLLRKRYNAFTPIPYAPFLIFAVIFYLYF